MRARGCPGEGSTWYEPVVRVKRMRGVFTVPDPARVTKLELEIEYAGGAAAWLNGREVARGHLAAGKLSGDAFAQGYPPEAYAWGIPVGKHNYPLGWSAWKPPSKKAARFRRLKISLDTRLLRKGGNILALSFRQSGHHVSAARWRYDNMSGYKATPWPHLAVRKMRLTVSPPGAAGKPARPRGVGLWAEDINRRVVNRDWGGSAGKPVIRMVGARNGTYSGQVIASASAPLGGVSAKMSDLKAVSGTGRIPAAAARVSYAAGTPLDALRESRFNRHNQFYNSIANRLLGRYAFGTGYGFKERKDRVRPSKELRAEARAITLFDHLAARPPATVPAGSCQPIWVTVKVPRDAAPGEYRGTLTVQAGGAKKVEVRLWVMAWALPDGKDRASFVGLQQSLWGSCRQYQAAPWSEKHWALLERSVKLLAGVGNDIAVVPLIVGGEAANAESLVPWVKKGPGYEYDFKNLDRYLGLVEKHWGKKVAVVGEICWAPYLGGRKGWVLRQQAITVVEGGVKKKLALPAPGSEEWKKLFLPFAKAVRERVKAKGLTLYWGWFYDGIPDDLRTMTAALAREIPGVHWARASHNGNTRRPFAKTNSAKVKLDMRIRGFPQSFAKTGEPVSRCGWKNPTDLLFPRHASQVQAVGRFESPMSIRWLTENCLVNGAAGFGRIGADYWPPFTFGNRYHPFVNYLLCPGPDGAESSVRFEALREGVQEAEVRIWLERNGKDKTEPAKSVLAARIGALSAMSTGSDYTPLAAYYANWQERSWDLYAAAARAAAGRAPSAADKKKFFAGE